MGWSSYNGSRAHNNGYIGGNMSVILIYLMAMSIGILVTIVPIMNGANTKVLGTLKVSFYHYFAAFITGLFFLFATASFQSFWKISNVPLYYFLGGILGLFVILLMNYYTVRIKALHIAILPFLGQMTMGLILDYFLFDKFDLKTIMGLSVVLLGLLVQGEQKTNKQAVQ